MFSWLRTAAKSARVRKTAPSDETELANRQAESEPSMPGIEDPLVQIPGMTAPMLVVLGEHGIKSLEDLAGCAVDDLHGWVEHTGETFTTHAGVLAQFGLSREECGAMIIKARIKAGWIEEPKGPSEK